MYKYNEKINISKEQWKELLLDKSVVRDSDKKLILRIYIKENHRVSATELSKEEGVHPSSYNGPVGYLGKRIIEHLDIDIPWLKADGEEKNYWHVLFLGRQGLESSHFEWELRPELKSAIDEIILETL